MNNFVRRGDEPPNRGKRFGERSHNNVDVVDDAEVCGSAVALRAEHADRVSVIYRKRRSVPLGELEKGGQVGDVTLHGVHAVYDHQLTAVGVFLQQCLELF